MKFPHLNGRAEALASELDIKPDVAEWLAVAALHAGCFLRAQYSAARETHRVGTERSVKSLSKQKLIVETPVEEIGLLCRITSKAVYRSLGEADSRHRREASWPVMCRRLLSLDYVIDHPGLPWLATEAEKLACFEQLGIQQAELPFREYRGAAIGGFVRRYFANKHPIAVDAEAKTAVFVYADSNERSPQGLRSWRAEHGPLWAALYRQGFRLKIVHAGRDPKLAGSVRRVFEGWARDAASEREVSRMKRELERLEKALLNDDDYVLDEYGGFSRAFRRSAELKGRLKHKIAVAGYKADYEVWLSKRIPAKDAWQNRLGPRRAKAQAKAQVANKEGIISNSAKKRHIAVGNLILSDDFGEP